MSFLSSLNISGTGMTAQRMRLDVAAENIANIETTRTEDGGPYRRKMIVLQAKDNSFRDVLSTVAGKSVQTNAGVQATAIIDDETELKAVYDPEHPDADENGYVSYPNVNTVTEMTNMISATRAYEANTTAFEASKSMARTGLSIGK